MTSTRLSVTLLAIVLALPFSATAQVFNPDNDSTAYFAANRAQRAIVAERSAPVTGETSPDGLYVWKNAEQGWVPAGHRYVVAGGRIMHASNCLAYDEPRPQRGIINDIGKGA